MNTSSFLLALLASFSLAACINVKFKDCGSVVGKITSVYIEPCTKDPCSLVKGSNSTISVSFIPNVAITEVKASVHGIIAGIPVPFPMEGVDGCKSSGLTCPLKAGVEVKYYKALPIKSDYPAIKLLVKWELKDEQNKDIVCAEIQVEIKAP